MIVTPCTAAEAYHLFVAITGCLGVQVDEAARLLERVVVATEKGIHDRRLVMGRA